MMVAAAIVLTMALMPAAVAGTFVFLQPIAYGVGLKGSALGLGMSVVSLVGAGGGLVATLLSRRIGSTIPLLAGLPVIGLLNSTLIIASSQASFWEKYPVGRFVTSRQSEFLK